jgi:hypothetical protein
MRKNMAQGPGKNSRGAECKRSAQDFKALSANYGKKSEKNGRFQPEICIFLHFLANSTIF